MSTGQVNGVYDISYFDAKNNEYTSSNNRIWWSSKHRYALEFNATTSEYIEIDLTKRRTLNYISFDIVQKPISIEIQYDSVDLDNLYQYSNTPRWKTVKKIDGEAFDSSISYQSDYSNPWKHCEFYFNDNEENVLVARRVRLKFTRRQDSWPTENYSAFAWSVDVKNLRVGRFITEQKHLGNTLINVGSYSGTREFPSEIIQPFFMSDRYSLASEPTANLSNIDSFAPSTIVPKLLGFELLVKPLNLSETVSLNWKLVYVVGEIETTLDSGNVEKTIVASNADINLTVQDAGDGTPATFFPEQEWIKVLFDRPIQSIENGRYEIRVRNVNPRAAKEFYTLSPNSMPFLNGEDFDLKLLDTGVIAETQSDECAVIRVIADIGNYGKDLLGNEYREGVRYNSASAAVDGKIYTNWTCQPNPSQDGVEALYLDVRKLVAGKYTASVIDAIEINTLTPGVKMNVYFSTQPMNVPPTNIDDWEGIIWTPVRAGFKLNQKQTIDLPYPIAANWICLEFYNLQSIPLGLSNYPILPEVIYKEFPRWVYVDNPKAQKTSDEPLLQKEKFVSYTVPEVFTPALENKEDTVRIYAKGPQTLDQNISENGFGSADPLLLSKISFAKNPFVTPSVKRVDTSTMLGSFIYDDYSNNDSISYIAEAQQYPRVVESRNVSNANDRRAFSRYEESDLLFNRACAHKYSVKKGRYNKKAYSVSVSEISLLRKDYSVEFDDPVIHDVLVYENADESLLIESSSFEPEERISIPIGRSFYLTYTVNDTEYKDELVQFEPATSDTASFEPFDLVGTGGIATNVIGRSEAFERGETYYRNQDFLIVYNPASKKNQIKRNDIPPRLVVGNVVNSIDRYTVVGTGIIDTEIDYPVRPGDIIELGKPEGQPVSTGSSSVAGTVTPPTTAESNGSAGIYATLTDPTD
jgi:hypothetical protein